MIASHDRTTGFCFFVVLNFSFQKFFSFNIEWKVKPCQKMLPDIKNKIMTRTKIDFFLTEQKSE